MGCALAAGEIVWVSQPNSAGLLQFRPVLLFCAADEIDGIVDNLDCVKLAEFDVGIEQMSGGASDEGRAHAGAHPGYVFSRTAVPSEGRREFLDGSGILVIGGEEHPRPVEINKQPHIIMAPARGGLAEGGPCNIRVTGAVAGFLYVMMENRRILVPCSP